MNAAVGRTLIVKAKDDFRVYTSPDGLDEIGRPKGEHFDSIVPRGTEGRAELNRIMDDGEAVFRVDFLGYGTEDIPESKIKRYFLVLSDVSIAFDEQ
jgi:hypothetical protein